MQFNIEKRSAVYHPELSPAAVKRNHEAVTKLKAAILAHGNPFAIEGQALFILITHAYIPDEHVPQILNMDDMGQKMFEEYVSDRINGNVSLWTPMKRQNNKMFTSGNKKHAVKVRDNIIDMKETKDLYGRFMVLTKSNQDVHQKDAIGNHKLTLTPRVRFAPNGSLLTCSDESKLIHVLEKLISEEIGQNSSLTDPEAIEVEDVFHGKKIAVVDGMVLVQKLSKNQQQWSQCKI